MPSVTEVKILILGINAWYRPQSGPWVMTTSPPPQPQPDPDYVSIQFVIEGLPESSGSIVLKKEDLRRMNLTVGDHAKLKLEPSQ